MNKLKIIDMKRFFFLMCNILISIVIYAQEQNLVLKSQLVNIENTVYIEIELKNNSKNNKYLFTYLSDLNRPTGPVQCILKPELEYVNGTVKRGVIQGFLCFNQNKRNFILEAQDSYQYKMPLLYRTNPDAIVGVVGAMPHSDIGNVKRIRFILDEVIALKMGEHIEKIATTLYSNWIDITP